MSGVRSSEILCVGRLYCDLIFSSVPRLPTLGTEVYAGGLELHLGGGAVITARHLDDLGRQVALSAVFPGPPFREFWDQEIARTGLDTSLCSEAEQGLDPQITVSMTGPQDRAFLTRRSGPATPDILPADLVARNVRHLHIGELATLAEVPRLIDVARDAGATLSLDCSWDETLDAAVAPLIGAVDVFLPNEEESERLRSLGVSEPFAPLTVTKRGPRGAVARQGNAFRSAPARDVPVTDTTGAGDAFNAGFLTAWLDGAELQSCLDAGNCRGSAAVQVVGGSPRRRPI